MFIGTIEILGLIGRQAGLTGGFLAFLQDFNINKAGFVIVDMFILAWAVAWSVWHFGKIEQKRHLAAKVRNQRRLALADEAGVRIGTTLDITRTTAELLEVAIPRPADAGAVDLLATVIDGDRHAYDQEMHLQEAALRWPADVPPHLGSLPHAWSETGPARLIRQRLAAGLPVYLPAFGAMTDEQIKEVASDAGFDRVMAARRGGAHSMMIIPLVARGVTMGLVALCRLAGSAPFTAADLALARDFVSRAAVCIDNARLYTRERATALALQRGLLPRRIPQVPGLDLAYRYVPAQTAAEVGGDWFDVIPLPAGRCALTVGDVRAVVGAEDRYAGE